MKHRLVVIGDSLSQGFMNGAIHRTDISFPVMIADALGIRSDFLVPDFKGEGGLPLNLESILDEMSDRYRTEINWWEVLPLAARLRSRLDRTEDYWERGKGSRAYPQQEIYHNLAVWGFEIRDAHTITEGVCRRQIREPKDNFLKQVPEMAMYRTARRVLNPAFANDAMERHQIRCAQELNNDGGIENLIVFLGANNALGTVTSLEIKYSESQDLYRLAHERTCNLYLPEHFDKLYTKLADDISSVGAENVFVATVPHVTIPPVTRGVSPDGTFDKGYFEYYTRPWIWDDDFDPDKHAHLTREQAQQIDGFIDQYNSVIIREAASRGWHVCDVGKLLNDMAYRRQNGSPKFKFPSPLVKAIKKQPSLRYLISDGKLQLDTRFITCNNEKPSQIAEGGLFGLDGMHPTTIGYGLMANTFIKAMKKQSVDFENRLDWNAVVRSDTLVNTPPELLVSLKSTLGMLDSQGLLSSIFELF